VPGASWTSAVAAVIDSGDVVRGTAFFVGKDVAITCLHVLDAAGDGPIRLRRVGSRTVAAVVDRDVDPALDLALVRIAAADHGESLVLSTDKAVDGVEVYSYGFPRNRPISRFPEGYPMEPAVLTGLTTVNWKGRPTQAFVLAGADVAQGMSGAPAVARRTDAVVGVLRFAERDSDTAYAVPAEAVRVRWPGLPPDAQTSVPTFSELTGRVNPVASTAWETFDPSLFHCVVVGSETDRRVAPTSSLAALVKEVLASEGALEMWAAFVVAWEGRRLLGDGHPRGFAKHYQRANVEFAALQVVDAFASRDSLATATRLIVEADLALFDVTGFEPGVMMLLGIRAATRRGVTISSHGAGWREGEPLNRPFNLSDLSLASHARAADLVGPDPRIARLAQRIGNGFYQLARHPHYLDVPVYDGLRQLGSQEIAWGSIPLEDEVLVLCSYDQRYFETWTGLRASLKEALSNQSIITNVARLQDVATPQLVSQSLYERIRRCAACVADWTFASPSTFLELGVRLAVSPWSVVQIANQEWLRNPKTLHGDDAEIGDQIDKMQDLFGPLRYAEDEAPAIGDAIAEQLVGMREHMGGSRGDPVRQVAARALCTTQVRLPDPVDQLADEADGLNHRVRIRENVPQALFYEVQEIKTDQERGALERRVAAWLYLEHRVGAGELVDDDPRKQQWRELGELVAADLFTSDEEADQALASEITERVS
jgi:hypothetical protein